MPYGPVSFPGMETDSGSTRNSFDDRINDRMRGVSRMDSLEILLEEYHGEPLTAAQKAALAEKKNQLYVGLLQNMGEADLSEEVGRLWIRCEAADENWQ